MRLFTIFIAFLSAVAAITLNKTDGTTIELGGGPMVVDLSNVIMPARTPVTESGIQTTKETTDVHAADWDRGASNVHFYEDVNYKGNLMTAYLCREGINSCMTLVNNDFTIKPSSIQFNTCPDGAPNHGRNFYCFFFSTGNCEPTARSLFLDHSVADLSTNHMTLGWNNKIKSVECYWDHI